jgi:acyl carrier protein
MEEYSRLQVEEGIKRILVSELQVDPLAVAALGPSTPLLGRGVGLDSMETLGLVVAIEEQFDIQVDDDDFTVDLFRDITTLADYVFRRTAGRRSGSVEARST